MKTIIVATAINNVIGKDNNLIWNLPADLKRFKELTMGHHIIMGRKTFESIKKPLQGRTTVIITRNKNYTQDGCKVVYSLKEAMKICKNDDNPFIIGGSQIYKQALDIADKIELTKVLHTFEGDAFFPELGEEWKVEKKEEHIADEKNKYNYNFITYVKVQ